MALSDVETLTGEKNAPFGKQNKAILHFLERFYSRVILFIDWLLGPQFNLFHFCGALAVLLIGVEIITGIYLFVLYDVTPQRTYQKLLSIQGLWLHRFVRTLHRYSSDMLMFLAVIHAIHMIMVRRVRRFIAWAGGIIAMVALFIAAVTGFLMVWDQNGKLLALWTGKLLSVLPFVDPSFLNALISHDLRMLSGFFRINLFGHLLFSGFICIAVWLHLNHLKRPLWLPPWRPAIIFLAGLCVVSAIVEAPLGGSASSVLLPFTVTVSVWYFLPLAGLKWMEPSMWFMVLIMGVLLALAIPIYKRMKRVPPLPG